VDDVTIASLPLLNATLNGIATILLVTGYVLIRRRRIGAHRAAMIAAFTASVLFLTSYVIYHAHAGSRPFPGRGAIRAVYFAILISHVILAAIIPPLAALTLWRGLRGRFDRHVAIARWTLPLWLYVSVTGIIVYVMLYRLY
jgi:putative membrane protein